MIIQGFHEKGFRAGMPSQAVKAGGPLLTLESAHIRFRASGWHEMCWHLYQWGDTIEVLEPDGLREMVDGYRGDRRPRFRAVPLYGPAGSVIADPVTPPPRAAAARTGATLYVVGEKRDRVGHPKSQGSRRAREHASKVRRYFRT